MRHNLFINFNRRQTLTIALLFASIAAALFWVALTTAATQQPAGEISPLQTMLRGQTQWLSGGPASLRVIATNHNTGAPATGTVKISLLDSAGRSGAKDQPQTAGKSGPITLFSGTLHEGTVDAQFKVPALAPGSYEMQVNVASALGTDSLKQNVTIARQTQILLTSDLSAWTDHSHSRAGAAASGIASRKRGENHNRS